MCWPISGMSTPGDHDVAPKSTGVATTERPSSPTAAHEAARGGGLAVVHQLVDGLHGRPPHALTIEQLGPLGGGAGGKGLVEDLDKGGGVGHAGEQVDESWVFGQVGPLDGPQEVRPVAVTLEPEQPEATAVGSAVVDDQRVGRGGPGQGHGRQPGAQGDAGIPAQHVGADAQQRRADQLALAGALADEQRRRHPARRRHRCHVVAHAATLVRQRRPVRRERGGDTGA